MDDSGGASQGDIGLAADVRYYAKNLPPALTDRERVASDFFTFIKEERDKEQRDRKRERVRNRGEEALTR